MDAPTIFSSGYAFIAERAMYWDASRGGVASRPFTGAMLLATHMRLKDRLSVTVYVAYSAIERCVNGHGNEKNEEKTAR